MFFTNKVYKSMMKVIQNDPEYSDSEYHSYKKKLMRPLNGFELMAICETYCGELEGNIYGGFTRIGNMYTLYVGHKKPYSSKMNVTYEMVFEHENINEFDDNESDNLIYGRVYLKCKIKGKRNMQMFVVSGEDDTHITTDDKVYMPINRMNLNRVVNLANLN